jgi:ABC-type multidrug transport system ATPase subunit
MQEIRENLGVCPQHNVLYPDLTVEEHLWLFSSFKGVPPGQSQGRMVQAMLDEVALTNKRHTKRSGRPGGHSERGGKP